MNFTHPYYLTEDYDDDRDVVVTPGVTGDSGLSYLMFIGVDESLIETLADKFKASRRSARSRAVSARQRLQRRTERVVKAKDLLLRDDVWYTSLNDPIKIEKMTPRHATRSLNLLTNEFGRWVGDKEISYEHLALIGPLHKTPLAKALQKRSNSKETKRHRELDDLSDMVFRAARAGGKIHVWETIEEFSKVHSG